MRDRFFAPFSDDDGTTDAFDFVLYLTIVIGILARHSKLGEDRIREALFRLCGYLCRDTMDVSGGVPHDASTGSAADTD